MGLFTGNTGSNPAIGAYDADGIDADVTANGSSSIPAQELAKMNSELNASGLDSSNLTTVQDNAATLALWWACVYQYTMKDRIRALANGDKCMTEDEHNANLRKIASIICNALESIGARSKYYCGYYVDDTATVLKNGDLVDYYPPDQFISIQEN